MTKIVWAGDSTVAFNSFKTYPQTGMGQALPRFLKKEIGLLNLAVNGRSTKSFIDEQRMVEAYFALEEGDIFLIQFGHNDKKKEDPARYAPAYGAYQENLKKFIHVARNKKAHPVLVTPIVRREASEGRLINTHEDYPAAVRDLAHTMEVPLIDLTKLSHDLVESYGIEEAKVFYMNFPSGLYPNYPQGLSDNTHLRPQGALVFASLLAKGLWDLGGPYRALINEAVESADDFYYKHFLEV
jgi:lysophospholipase L1-like esterase